MSKEFDKKYWSPDKLLSRNKLFNFILSNRGCGKSFAAKRIVISQFLKHKKQFVYVRRYENEFNDIQTFFSDIYEFYEGHKFEVKAGKFYIDDEVAGYYFALSTSTKRKSTSYPGVAWIIFDEFIIDKGRISYLKQEVPLFLDLYETIARMRDVRVMFISNTISTINPYFLYFKIPIRPGSKFIMLDDIGVEIYKGEEYTEEKRKTRFGKLVAGTKYGDYAIEAEFYRDNKNFIEKMHGNGFRPRICIKYDNKIYSVWYNTETGYIHMSKSRAPQGTPVFCFFNEDHMPNVLFVENAKANPVIASIYHAYEISYVRFDNLECKEVFCECMNLFD